MLKRADQARRSRSSLWQKIVGSLSDGTARALRVEQQQAIRVAVVLLREPPGRAGDAEREVGQLGAEQPRAVAAHRVAREPRPVGGVGIPRSGVGECFKRVKPAKEFSWGESWGAVELAVRYGSIDGGDLARLDMETKDPDDTLAGPRLDDLTVGVNIYHNPTFRTMFNYVYSDMDGGEEVHAFMVRWQIGL